MKYSRNAVYTVIRNAVKAEYSDAYVTGIIAAVPTKSPSVMVQEVSLLNNPEAQTFGYTQPVRTSTFEAQVFSNKEDTGMSECNNIMETVKEAFVSLGYLHMMQTIVENGENSKYRIVSRFRRVIGDNDEMPSSE